MLRQLRVRQITLPLVWDVIMVYVATVNVGLILFDLTYLNMRPFYFRYVPALVRLYDPVKGIQPNPVTEAIMEHAAAVEALLAAGDDGAALRENLERLRELSRRMVMEDPFERSGQSRNLLIIERVVADAVHGGDAALLDRSAEVEAFRRFWTPDRDRLVRHLGIYDRRIGPLLAVNYYRGYDLDGKLEDHFWKLDLPFLIVFWVEFAVRWVLAIRKSTYPRWFFFPIVDWYDLLGLLPYRHLRFFRLFRIISIYVRLRRSTLSGVGEDVVTRSVSYLTEIVAEEVSDRVAVRILTELQEEIRDGTHVRILAATLEQRRGELEAAVVRQLQGLLSRDETQARLREVYAMALDTAVDRTRAVRDVPLPTAVVRPLVRYVAATVFEAVLETVVATLESDEGRVAVTGLVTAVVDDTFSGARLRDLDGMTREIAVELIERMKAAVAVKKWMEGDGGEPGGGDDGAGDPEPR